MVRSGRSTRVALALAGALLAAGCSAQVAETGTYVAPAPGALPDMRRPSVVLVATPTASPAIVQLDNGPGAQAQRAAAGLSPEEARERDVREVQDALADTLVQQIRAMGLRAERVHEGARPGPGELIVTGQVTAIQEGHRARRVLVGFGAGKSQVVGEAQVLRGRRGAPPELLQTYSTDANSGRMPGLGVGAAAGAGGAMLGAAGAAHVAGEVERSPVGQEAERIAKRLAISLGGFFASQNWIPPSAVPSAIP